MFADIPSRLLVRTAAPAVEPLTLSEAKLYLRVDGTAEDTLITDMIVAVRIAAEEYLRKSLITQSWKLAFDDCLDEFNVLPRGPVQSVTSVTLVERDGATSTLSSNAYYLNAAKDTLILDAPVFAHRIEIVYQTGYGVAASNMPQPVRSGMLAHLAALYDRREEGAALPPSAIQAYEPFRTIQL